MKRFKLYWGKGQVSCFTLKNRKQMEAIAKQYPNVKKIEEN